jgi:hypothetical protein
MLSSIQSPSHLFGDDALLGNVDGLLPDIDLWHMHVRDAALCMYATFTSSSTHGKRVYKPAPTGLACVLPF